jgi:hypothetical protein
MKNKHNNIVRIHAMRHVSKIRAYEAGIHFAVIKTSLKTASVSVVLHWNEYARRGRGLPQHNVHDSPSTAFS